MNILLTGKVGKKGMNEAIKHCPSAISIQRFNKKGGGYFYRQVNPDGTTRANPTVTANNSTLIRWGTRMELPSNNALVYNTCEGIRNASNKARGRDIMYRAGVSVPKAVSPRLIKSRHLPVIARPHVHAQGKNFIVLRTKREYARHYDTSRYYYSRYIDKDQEFRVHCAHGKVLRLLEKPRPAEGGMAWNHHNVEDPFVIVRHSQSQPYVEVMKQALMAVQALGLDFGAADVIFKNGRAYVLEVNTAPSIESSEISSSKWGRYFNWLFRSNTRREHFDFTRFTDGQSYFFTNSDFDG